MERSSEEDTPNKAGNLRTLTPWYDGVDWIKLIQEQDPCWTSVNTIMNHSVAHTERVSW